MWLRMSHASRHYGLASKGDLVTPYRLAYRLSTPIVKAGAEQVLAAIRDIDCVRADTPYSA